MTAPDPLTPIPAATLVLMRDRSGAAPVIAMVERSSAMAFGGGALVFPGGRVDPGDHALAATIEGAEPEDAAARIAAIRETLEEAGIAIGLDPVPAPPVLATIRAALLAGEPFAPLLARAGVAFRLDALVPFAHWQPAPPIKRIFDTRFYLARLPEDAAPGTVDEGENVRLIWSAAADVLAQAAAGAVRLMLPTRCNLQRLARFATHADAMADARAHPVERITPSLEERDGVAYLTIPEGLGYPVVSIPLADR